jgi:hypothetical protein
MSNLNNARAAAVIAAGTFTAIALNPVAAFAHEGEPLPLPEGTAPAETISANNSGGTPNLLVAGVIVLAALAVGAVIVGKLTKSKSADK